MLMWSLVFLLIAIGAGILAFTGIAIAITFYAKFLFFVSILCFIIFLVLFLIRKKVPPPE